MIKFDVHAFYKALDVKRQDNNLTWKQVSKLTDVSASTLTRLSQGKKLDVDLLAKLLAWAEYAMEAFITDPFNISKKFTANMQIQVVFNGVTLKFIPEKQ